MGLIPTFSNGLHWYIYYATETTKLLCLRNTHTHTHTWWTSFKYSVDYYIKIIGLPKWYCPKSVNMKLYVFTAEITSELTQDFNNMLKVGMLLGMDPLNSFSVQWIKANSETSQFFSRLDYYLGITDWDCGMQLVSTELV